MLPPSGICSLSETGTGFTTGKMCLDPDTLLSPQELLRYEERMQKLPKLVLERVPSLYSMKDCYPRMLGVSHGPVFGKASICDSYGT